MARLRRACALVALTMVVGCSIPSSPDRAGPDDGDVTLPGAPGAIVELTNAERESAGLAPLSTNARLAEAARLHAEQVAAARLLEHTLPDARYPSLADRLAAAGYDWQRTGENLASGYPDAAAVIGGWMGSSAHRANILNEAFTEVGAATATDASGRRYYVQVFGRPR